jgi:DNA topoisomerase VI subunit A
MDNKMRRIWPMDINEYNLSFTSKEKKLDSSSIKEVKKYKNVNQDSRFSNINFRDIFNKILGF